MDLPLEINTMRSLYEVEAHGSLCDPQFAYIISSPRVSCISHNTSASFCFPSSGGDRLRDINGVGHDSRLTGRFPVAKFDLFF